MEAYKLRTRDGYSLSVHTFDAASPNAVVQIIHGMEEHQERYEPFIHFLTQNGYTVVSSDLRGHGYGATDLGHFKSKNGYLELIADQVRIRRFIQKKYPDLPVYLFAHSMGTIIARMLLQRYSQRYEKVVLCGYPNYRPQVLVGLFCASVIKVVKGPKYKSDFLEYTSIGIFNRSVSNPQSYVDWISSSPNTVRSFIDDPYCGVGFSCSAFSDLYHLLLIMRKWWNYTEVHKDMPILMIRGTEDPCVGGDKGAWKSFLTLSLAGFLNITRIDYPEMRHELLNEINKHKVYEDILDFFED